MKCHIFFLSFFLLTRNAIFIPLFIIKSHSLHHVKNIFQIQIIVSYLSVQLANNSEQLLNLEPKLITCPRSFQNLPTTHK